MNVINPIEVTDSVLTSSNIPEDDAPAWESSTSYSTGAEVLYEHSVYRSLVDSNQGNIPTADNQVSPVNWLRVSASNRWAMFSDQINDQSEFADEIDVSFLPGSVVNAIAFFNLDAAEIQVTMTDPVDGVVYDRTFSLVDAGTINTWYGWYFDPLTTARSLAALDLPPYRNATLRAVIRKDGGTAKCGRVTFGAQQNLGITNLNSGIGILDYSRKERDQFGEPVIVKRNFAKRANYLVSVETQYVDSVQNTLSDLRTVPLTWIGDPNFPSTIIFGYYKDFDIVLTAHSVSTMNLEIEGLT